MCDKESTSDLKSKGKQFRQNDYSDNPLVLPKSVAEKQRLQIDKLMRHPEKPVYIPDRPKDRKSREPPEFVRDVMGSSAGAGSGEFHVYRGYRRREYGRQMYIQNKAEQEEQAKDFQKKLEENKSKAEEKTTKKRNKRMKKKQKMFERKKQKLEGAEGNECEMNTEEVKEQDLSETGDDDAEENCFLIGGR
ncbi:PRKR-interacting protein 1 homolog [Asterias rubens]|uniref:PRKR-interacting protein 1 homolog n=1 Tax=Asterias rubens TaxID=7604 RepID=UPI00145556A4|nr:PRKR-interacting protein 1 homolog [Asterias rubens]